MFFLDKDGLEKKVGAKSFKCSLNYLSSL